MDLLLQKWPEALAQLARNMAWIAGIAIVLPALFGIGARLLVFRPDKDDVSTPAPRTDAKSPEEQPAHEEAWEEFPSTAEIRARRSQPPAPTPAAS